MSKDKTSNKTRITIRIDNDLLEYLKTPKTKGYQRRLNEFLREAIDLEIIAREDEINNQLRMDQDNENANSYELLAEFSSRGC